MFYNSFCLIFITYCSSRYYYAVVECDSSATADYLYKSCDGAEFERSSNVLDLRFIPDSMEFKHEPRDVAVEVCHFDHYIHPPYGFKVFA